MAQYHHIKILYEREGLSQRQIAERLGLSRNTVSKYLKQGEMPSQMKRKSSTYKKAYSNEVQRVLPIIDEWLEADRKTWKKQHHTAARIYHRLVDEYQFEGSQSNIRAIVRQRKAKMKEVFIPLVFQFGHQFQFDWGEADVAIAGTSQRVYISPFLRWFDS